MALSMRVIVELLGTLAKCALGLSVWQSASASTALLLDCCR
jgi:hypothetical protein